MTDSLLFGAGGAQLTLTSEPQTSGTYCPGPVTFTCVGTQTHMSLFWLVNSSSVITYGFRDTDTFPFPLSVSPPLDGVMATVTDASISPPGASTIDITSVLSVSDVSVLNGASLQCENNEIQSNMLRINAKSKFSYNYGIRD